MRLFCLAICFAVVAPFSVWGGDKASYPYDAVVEEDGGAAVWSGPDKKKHYPTAQLNKGVRVKVLRSDMGGWCVIEPPEGSHGWIQADAVDKDGNNRGSINQRHVRVRVGSDVNPDHITASQVELSIGDAVEILGEKDFELKGASVRMLKISPIVNREWRWVRRTSINPLGAVKPFPNDSMELDMPQSQLPVPATEEKTKSSSHAQAKQESRGQESRGVVAAERTDATKKDRDQNQPPGKQRLSKIDHEFRDMIKGEREEWNLDAIEDQYLQLDEEIATPWMESQIAGRLEAVKRYRKTYNEYTEFVKLTTDAKQRDEQLKAIQVGYQIQAAVRPKAMLEPVAASQDVVQAKATSNSTTTPAFDGAGIVKKLAQSFPGGPKYVLITPEGKALTFLQPTPGVDLDRYDGKAMGIFGPRARREDWSSDVINVQRLQPVQLRDGKSIGQKSDQP